MESPWERFRRPERLRCISLPEEMVIAINGGYDSSRPISEGQGFEQASVEILLALIKESGISLDKVRY